jgi:hypothetical protein
LVFFIFTRACFSFPDINLTNTRPVTILSSPYFKVSE